MNNIITNIRMINIHKLHLLNGGGGLVSTDTLNSGAIIINIEDYNSVSTGVL